MVDGSMQQSAMARSGSPGASGPVGADWFCDGQGLQESRWMTGGMEQRCWLCWSMLDPPSCSSVLKRNRCQDARVSLWPPVRVDPAAKTLLHAQVTDFKHMQDARTRLVTPIRAGPRPESHA